MRLRGKNMVSTDAAPGQAGSSAAALTHMVTAAAGPKTTAAMMTAVIPSSLITGRLTALASSVSAMAASSLPPRDPSPPSRRRSLVLSSEASRDRSVCREPACFVRVGRLASVICAGAEGTPRRAPSIPRRAIDSPPSSPPASRTLGRALSCSRCIDFSSPAPTQAEPEPIDDPMAQDAGRRHILQPAALQPMPEDEEQEGSNPMAQLAQKLLYKRLGIVQEGEMVTETEVAITKFVNMFQGKLPDITVVALDCDLAAAVEDALLAHGGEGALDQPGAEPITEDGDATPAPETRPMLLQRLARARAWWGLI